jgi:hypothetical protein
LPLVAAHGDEAIAAWSDGTETPERRQLLLTALNTAMRTAIADEGVGSVVPLHPD